MSIPQLYRHNETGTVVAAVCICIADKTVCKILTSDEFTEMPFADFTSVYTLIPAPPQEGTWIYIKDIPNAHEIGSLQWTMSQAREGEHGVVPEGCTPPHTPKLGDKDYWAYGDEVIDLSRNKFYTIKNSSKSKEYFFAYDDFGGSIEFTKLGIIEPAQLRVVFHVGSGVKDDGTIHEALPLRVKMSKWTTTQPTKPGTYTFCGQVLHAETGAIIVDIKKSAKVTLTEGEDLFHQYNGKWLCSEVHNM